MTGFTCTHCGKCCISLGSHIRLGKSASQFSHTIHVTVSKETRQVQIDPDLRDIFLQTTAPSYENGWCPFLRRTADGMYVCTIYASRPGVCRSFRCCTMRILDPEGREIGKVKGRRSLSTTDPRLTQVWSEEIIPFTTLPDGEFFSRCGSVLKTHGFGCEIYDP